LKTLAHFSDTQYSFPNTLLIVPQSPTTRAS
jgi:hypothetical protein